jgi:hypothetical protein
VAAKFKPASLFNLIAYFTADLQLDVAGCRDLYASFDKFVEVARLEGDNKYASYKSGLQVSFWSSCLHILPMKHMHPLSMSLHIHMDIRTPMWHTTLNPKIYNDYITVSILRKPYDLSCIVFS